MTDEQLRKWATEIWGTANWTEIQIGRLRRFAEMAAKHHREEIFEIVREEVSTISKLNKKGKA